MQAPNLTVTKVLTWIQLTLNSDDKETVSKGNVCRIQHMTLEHAARYI